MKGKKEIKLTDRENQVLQDANVIKWHEHYPNYFFSVPCSVRRANRLMIPNSIIDKLLNNGLIERTDNPHYPFRKTQSNP